MNQTTELPLQLSIDARKKFHKLRMDLHQLLGLRDFANSPQFKACLALADQIESDLRVQFPGQSAKLAGEMKARGTQGECIEYAVELGLLPNDGEWFYYKMTGCGWKNGKIPVKDWKATMRAWKLAGYMASQRNGAVRISTARQPQTIMERELHRGGHYR